MSGQIPEVSIGLPVYQGEKFLRLILDNLLSQSFQDFELIISDNASTDDTERICREIAAQDNRIRYHRCPENLGPFVNYWKVYELSKAPYFKWNSANDLCSPVMIEKCLQTLKDHPDAVLAYMKTKLIDYHGKELRDFDDRMDIRDERPSARFIKFKANFRLSNALYGVIRSEALRAVRPFGKYRSSDEVLFAELALEGKFIEVPEIGFYRRIGEQASTTHASGEELQKFYRLSPAKTSQMVLWRIDTEHFRSVFRAKISTKERFRLYYYLVRLLIWHRHGLLQELLSFLRLTRKPVTYTSSEGV